MSIPRSLKDRLRNRRVIPFVGAGVSMSILNRSSGARLFPSWRELLDSAADRLDQETKKADADLVRSFLNVKPPEFLEAAGRARKALGPIWYEFLKGKLDVQLDMVDPTSLEFARRIWNLGSNLIITTNYDEVLKWACPRKDDLQSWNIEAPVEQASLLQQKLNRPVLWHLHGQISNAAELILSPDGYKLLYPETDGGDHKVKHEAALTTLRFQLVSKSFLFIGFSLEDEYFGMQLESVHETYKGAAGPHYALVREDQAERVGKLNIEPVTFSDFGEPLMVLLDELKSAADSPRQVSETPTVIPDYGPHRSVFYVPFKQKGDQIVGQQQVLEDVRRQLTQGNPTAIGQTVAFRGLGGLGKTQLAIEYAYRYRDEYPNGVIWLNADQNIDAQLIEIAEKARWIAPESEHKYKIQIAQQRLRSYSDCLIIFDNLEDRRTIDPYLPEPEANPHILVTSRFDFAGFTPVPLGLLNEKLSLELLVKEARRDPENEAEEKAANGIVVLLQGLPLALELAGAYLGHRRSMTFQQYYELLGKDLKSALPKDVRSFTGHEADLYGTLRLSEGLLKEEPCLREVLDLLTWSGSAPMSTDLISHLLGISNDGVLAGALSFGDELRLLQGTKDQDSYSLHRLVGEVRRGEIPLDQRHEWVATVCTRLGGWFEGKRDDFSQLSIFESEIDHLKKWQEHAARFAPFNSSRLMWLQAYPAYHRGRYVEARRYVIEAQRIFDDLNDSDLELKANLLNDLAYTNSELGETESVLANHLEVLKIRRNLFREGHSDIAASLGLIGNWLGEQGDLRGALEYSEQALAMRRELYGEQHLTVAGSLTSVARWYGEQGDLRRALEYSEEALTMVRRLFVKHPAIAASLNSVAQQYGQQGNLQTALEYSKQALTMRYELLGERHPDIAASLNNVGSWYGEQGDLQAALKYSEHALSMRRELFGDQNPDIAVSLNNVGYWYGEQGHLQIALEYSEKALAMQRKLFGERHPDIATSLNNIGRWYGQQEDLKRALDHFEKALVMQRELFGERHPHIATSLNNIGTLHQRKEDLKTALEYLNRALIMRRELFGERHPDIASSLNNIGNWYADQGELKLSLGYLEQALAMQLSLFGDRHPDIARSLNNIGSLYARKRDLNRALDYSEQALTMRRELFGDRHPDIATSLDSIASRYAEQGDLQRALKYTEQSLTMRRDLFGNRHLSTIKSATQVAVILARLNRRKEAYDLICPFLVLAQGPVRDQLKHLEAQLLSKTIRPGFRQPSKSGKRKGKKKRR